MTATKSLDRRAKRLGIDMAAARRAGEAVHQAKPGRNMGGASTTTYGRGRTTRFVVVTANGYAVRYRGRQVAEVRTFGEAEAVARFLGTKANRRAWKGIEPKARVADRQLRCLHAAFDANGLCTECRADAASALAEALAQANGGAVRVMGTAKS